MQIVLDLTPQEENALKLAAQECGLTVDDYIRARLLAGESSSESPTGLSFLREESRVAVRAAQERLTSQGIGYVFGRQGDVIRRNPDGSEEVVASAATEAPADNVE